MTIGAQEKAGSARGTAKASAPASTSARTRPTSAAEVGRLAHSHSAVIPSLVCLSAVAPAAIAAAWAPWAQQQLHRGMAPEELKGYLARGGVDAAAVLRAAADEHARRGGDARAWLRSVGAASYEDN